MRLTFAPFLVLLVGCSSAPTPPPMAPMGPSTEAPLFPPQEEYTILWDARPEKARHVEARRFNPNHPSAVKSPLRAE